MAIITPGRRETPWGEVLSPIGEILRNRVEQHREQQMQMQQQQQARQQQMQQGNMLDQIFSQLPQNASPVDFMRAFAQAQGQGVSPEAIKPYQESFPKYQAEANKQEAAGRKQQEGLEPYRRGLDILSQQRKLLEKGNLGPLVGLGSRKGWFGEEGRKDRAEYERLGKALISLGSNIPIRNRQEFETLAEGLFDPTKDQKEIEGTLDAMQQIIQGQLGNESLESAGTPEVLGRKQGESSDGDVIARHRKTGKTYKIPRSEFKEHPDLEVMNQ